MGKTILDMLAADPNVSQALKAVLTSRAMAKAPSPISVVGSDRWHEVAAEGAQDDREDRAARQLEREDAS